MRLKIMTFNVRGTSLDREGPKTWEQRAPLNVAVIRSQAPDLIGFQECDPSHLLTYQQYLPEYTRLLGSSIIPEARGIRAYNAIFWRAEDLTFLHSGSFWLSETPEVPSCSWNAASPRLATWATFRFSTGCELFHLNTHLDHLSQEARLRDAELILHRLPSLCPPSTTLLLTGDFNCRPGDVVYRLFQESGFNDTYLVTGHEKNELAASFHAYGWSKPSSSDTKRQGARRFDWILFADPTERLHPLSCEIIRDAQPPVYPSDHYPVVAEFEVR